MEQDLFNAIGHGFARDKLFGEERALKRSKISTLGKFCDPAKIATKSYWIHYYLSLTYKLEQQLTTPGAIIKVQKDYLLPGSQA